MECPNPDCQHWVEWDEMACPKCHTPFYKAEILSDLIYNSPKTDLSIRLENLGLNTFITSELLFNGIGFRCPEKEVKRGQCPIWKPRLPDGVAHGEYPLGIKVWFQGKELDLHIDGGKTVEILPLPELELPRELELRPSNDLRLNLPIILKNARQTRCFIESLEFHYPQGSMVQVQVLDREGQPQNSSKLRVELGSIPDKQTCTCRIVEQAELKLILAPHELEKMAPGLHPLEIYLKGPGDSLLLKQEISLKRYDLPSIALEAGRWMADSFNFNSVKEKETISWRAPLSDRARKRLRLKTQVSGNPKFLEQDVTLTLRCPLARFEGQGDEGNKFSFSGEENVDLEILEMPGYDSSLNKKIQSGEMNVVSSKGEKKYDLRVERFRAEASTFKLSLDFGTTQCCVAIVKPNTQGKFTTPDALGTIPIDYSPHPASEMLPSAVAREGRKILVGKEAVRGEFVPVKFHIFRGDNEEIRNRCRVDAKIIMETCLRRTMDWLIDQPEVKEILFPEIILAVPTSFKLPWKQELHDLCLEAGKNVFGTTKVTIVVESMAAMRYFQIKNENAKNQTEKKNLVVICDFGGGSTDISFLQSLEENGKRLFKPLIQGGMRAFGGYQIDKIIQDYAEEKCKKKITLLTAENIKKKLTDNLDDKTDLFGILGSYLEITEETKQLRLRNDLLDTIETELVSRFQQCFEPLIARARKKMQPGVTENGVLLLLAGNGSKLARFSDYLESAWFLAATKEGVDLGELVVKPLDEPKKCVALGGFYTAFRPRPGDWWAPPGDWSRLPNTVPEDIFLGVGEHFEAPDAERMIKFGEHFYYLLFESGDLIGQDDKISLGLPAASMGIEGTQTALTFEIYVCFPGEMPEIYGTLKCTLPPTQDSWGDILFAYSPGDEGRLVTVKSC